MYIVELAKKITVGMALQKEGLCISIQLMFFSEMLFVPMKHGFVDTEFH